jgi:hypothetical protein
MFRRPLLFLVFARSRLSSSNEASFKQHDKREVIGSKVNRFSHLCPQYLRSGIRGRAAASSELLEHHAYGRNAVLAFQACSASELHLMQMLFVGQNKRAVDGGYG